MKYYIGIEHLVQVQQMLHRHNIPYKNIRDSEAKVSTLQIILE